MKIKTKQSLRILAAATLLLGGIGVSSAMADEGFSNESLQGAYGLNGSGTLAGTAFSTVGRAVLDGHGHCTYVTTMSVGGAPYGPIAATSCSYSVNADGTGSLNLTLPALGAGTFAFVLVSNAREVLGIINTAGYIATITAKQQ